MECRLKEVARRLKLDGLEASECVLPYSLSSEESELERTSKFIADNGARVVLCGHLSSLFSDSAAGAAHLNRWLRDLVADDAERSFFLIELLENRIYTVSEIRELAASWSKGRAFESGSERFGRAFFLYRKGQRTGLRKNQPGAGRPRIRTRDSEILKGIAAGASAGAIVRKISKVGGASESTIRRRIRELKRRGPSNASP